MVGDICVSKHTRKNHSGTNVVVRDLFYKVRMYSVHDIRENLTSYTLVSCEAKTDN